MGLQRKAAPNCTQQLTELAEGSKYKQHTKKTKWADLNVFLVLHTTVVAPVSDSTQPSPNLLIYKRPQQTQLFLLPVVGVVRNLLVH